MKKLLVIAVIAASAAFTLQSNTTLPICNTDVVRTLDGKLSIKIKNDTDDDFSVYNSGSSSSYRLAKNVTTTIKMDVGDKLFYYEKGKKGKEILTATAAMDGKVQLYSKL